MSRIKIRPPLLTVFHAAREIAREIGCYNVNLDWKDVRKYGFITVDGGIWYTRTLKQLFFGARVFACISGTCCVGVAEVLETVKSINKFSTYIDVKPVNRLNASLNGSYMKEKMDNPEECTYFVRVKWIKALPREQAYWEKSMYANQHSVTELRNRFTLERHQHFAIDSECYR